MTANKEGDTMNIALTMQAKDDTGKVTQEQRYQMIRHEDGGSIHVSEDGGPLKLTKPSQIGDKLAEVVAFF